MKEQERRKEEELKEQERVKEIRFEGTGTADEIWSNENIAPGEMEDEGKLGTVNEEALPNEQERRRNRPQNEEALAKEEDRMNRNRRRKSMAGMELHRMNRTTE
jgi:hypothetical protein